MTQSTIYIFVPDLLLALSFSCFYNQIIMDLSQKNQPKKHIWRWIVLGFAVILNIVWLTLTPAGLLGKADAVGYAVCHRISARSFHIGDRPVAMCARCSGMFLGALLGMIFHIVQGKKGKMPPVLVLVILGLLAAAWVLDGSNSFLMLTDWFPSLYTTENWTRLVTGTGMGLGVSAMIYPAFIQTNFKTWKDESGLGHWKQVLILFLAAGALDAIILLEIPWILYPLSLLSALSVLMLLTMIYTMVIVMLSKKENTYEGLRQLIFPLIGGFCVALFQIGVIDLVRFLWTGTWEGFIL